MSECENCGVQEHWEMYGYLNRFCFNCKWDKQPERKDLPDGDFKQYFPSIEPVTKETLENIINIFNHILEKSRNNEYSSKQDIIDNWYELCSEIAEHHDLDIPEIKYYEMKKPYHLSKEESK